MGVRSITLAAMRHSILEWLHMPGDIVFIFGGAVPAFYLTWLGVRYVRAGSTTEEPKDILFQGYCYAFLDGSKCDPSGAGKLSMHGVSLECSDVRQRASRRCERCSRII